MQIKVLYWRIYYWERYDFVCFYNIRTPCFGCVCRIFARIHTHTEKGCWNVRMKYWVQWHKINRGIVSASETVVCNNIYEFSFISSCTEMMSEWKMLDGKMSLFSHTHTDSHSFSAMFRSDNISKLHRLVIDCGYNSVGNKFVYWTTKPKQILTDASDK